MFKIDVILYTKKKEKTGMCIYRPLSLKSNKAKVFERIVKTRLVNFTNKYRITDEREYGFSDGRSTEDAIHALKSDIYEFFPTICSFVDLSKAHCRFAKSNFYKN